jgi:hypothetical protein
MVFLAQDLSMLTKIYRFSPILPKKNQSQAKEGKNAKMAKKKDGVAQKRKIAAIVVRC